MLKAIFFDLDGTLCRFHGNFKEIFTRCCSSIFQTHSSLTYDVILNVWNNVLGKEGTLTTSSALQKVCFELNIALSVDYEEPANLLCQTYANHIALINNVNELLQSLSKNYKLVLITNGPVDMQNAVINSLGIRGYFEAILISGDPCIRCRKPNSTIFQLALEATKTCNKEVLMVGDNLKVDIEGAKNLGLHTLFVGKTDDTQIKSIEDINLLLDILKRDFCYFSDQ